MPLTVAEVTHVAPPFVDVWTVVSRIGEPPLEIGADHDSRSEPPHERLAVGVAIHEGCGPPNSTRTPVEITISVPVSPHEPEAGGVSNVAGMAAPPSGRERRRAEIADDIRVLLAGEAGVVAEVLREVNGRGDHLVVVGLDDTQVDGPARRSSP